MKKTTQIISAAMLAALCCIATLIIRVPTLGTSGYVNIGDTIVLVSAWLLGPVYGGLAAGIGSALADMLAGYASYIPGTFVIKFLMAFTAAIIAKKLHNKLSGKKGLFVSYVISSVVAELIMIAGYFIYESTILGYGIGAASSIISNSVQGLTCLILGVLLINVLNGVRNIPRYIKKGDD